MDELPALGDIRYDPFSFTWYAEDSDGFAYTGLTPEEVLAAYRAEMARLQSGLNCGLSMYELRVLRLARTMGDEDWLYEPVC